MRHPMPISGVYYLIYLGQGEATFWANVIQVSVVNTDSPLSFIFWDHDYVRQPLRIFYFPDELGN